MDQKEREHINWIKRMLRETPIHKENRKITLPPTTNDKNYVNCSVCEKRIKLWKKTIKHTNISQKIKNNYFCCQEHKQIWIKEIQNKVSIRKLKKNYIKSESFKIEREIK